MIINEDYINTILYCFYKCRVKRVDNRLGYVNTNKNIIANLKDNYTFKPMYTLIPLNKGQNANKTINLETTENISKIPNLNYKLS